MKENLTFHEPTERQLEKFRKINAKSQEEQDEECRRCIDCSVCPLAIHQILFSTVKHICTCGMTEREFRIKMADEYCDY